MIEKGDELKVPALDGQEPQRTLIIIIKFYTLRSSSECETNEFNDINNGYQGIWIAISPAKFLVNE